MSRYNRTWRPRIRWGVLFEPWCQLRGHRWVDVEGFHAGWDPSGNLCTRCGRFVSWLSPMRFTVKVKPPEDPWTIKSGRRLYKTQDDLTAHGEGE